MEKTDVPSHHQAEFLDMLQIQRLSILFLPPSICGLEIVPVHEHFPTIIVPFEIIFPADGTLFSAIWTLWQKLVLQY